MLPGSDVILTYDTEPYFSLQTGAGVLGRSPLVPAASLPREVPHSVGVQRLEPIPGAFACSRQW